MKGISLKRKWYITIVHPNFLGVLAPSVVMKIIIAIAFILIIGSLGSALIYLMKDKGQSHRTVRALAFRVGFSVALFILLLVANHFGLIQATGIRSAPL